MVKLIFVVLVMVNAFYNLGMELENPGNEQYAFKRELSNWTVI